MDCSVSLSPSMSLLLSLSPSISPSLSLSPFPSQSLNLDWELTNHHSRAPCNSGKNRFINISPCEWAVCVTKGIMTGTALFPWQQMTTAELSLTAQMMNLAVTTSTPLSWMWVWQHTPLPALTPHSPPPCPLTPHSPPPRPLTPHSLPPRPLTPPPSGLQKDQGLHCLTGTNSLFH